MTSSTPLAYSYLRFSSKRQEEGDSVRRQDTGAKQWAEKNEIPLDTSLKIDKGISAFKGKNADLGSLGEFIRMVDKGRVNKGSYFVVESLDRISRNEVQEALLLILSLLKKGIRIVQLTPVEMVYDAKSDTTALIIMIVELSRGHSESKVKSDRIKGVWSHWREGAAKGERTRPPGRHPSWVKWDETSGSYDLIEGPSAAVRRIFQLAAEGQGIRGIIDRLNKDQVPSFGRTKIWGTPLVAKLLRGREALGELRVKGGLTLKGFYPPLIGEEDWLRARAAIGSRRSGRKGVGRPGVNVASLLTSLVRDARDGEYLQLRGRERLPSGAWRNPGMVSAGARMRRNGSGAMFVPYQTLECAILRFIKELSPEDCFDDARPQQEQLLQALDGKVADIESRLAKVKAAAAKSPNVESLLDLIVTLDSELTEAKKQRDGQAASLSVNTQDSLGEANSLIDMLRSASAESPESEDDEAQENDDEAQKKKPKPRSERHQLREKVKFRLRQVIDCLWVFVYEVSRSVRGAEVQVFLKSGVVRVISLAWCCRGRYPGLSVAVPIDVGDSDRRHLRDKLLSNYRTDGSTREFFEQHIERLKPAVLEAIDSELKVREAVAQSDKARGTNGLADYLANCTLDGTPPPVHTGRHTAGSARRS
jgi:DNA invertase Pin-like site-specific DNA recombinase